MQEFSNNDIFHTRIITHPSSSLFVYDGRTYYQGFTDESGSFYDPIGHFGSRGEGGISLYEMNVDRPANGLIYPFIVKDGDMQSFRTISTSSFWAATFGTTLTGSYPLTASITREYHNLGDNRRHLVALRNFLDYRYAVQSSHYRYSSSLGDKGTQELSLISIPSIFFGSSIDKGSVDLQFYISGTMIGRITDWRENGELVEVTGSSTGSVAGVVLYNEGFIILTGSWPLETGIARNYLNDPTNLVTSSWVYYGTGMNDGTGSGVLPLPSFVMNFRGTQCVDTITMLAHLPPGQFNHSNNPTYIQFGQDGAYIPTTGSTTYRENSSVAIKNMVQTDYENFTGSFEKITYVSSVKIMDADKNVIAVAKLTNPVRKRPQDSYTIKMKLDI